jgi:hypothetical protein
MEKGDNHLLVVTKSWNNPMCISWCEIWNPSGSILCAIFSAPSSLADTYQRLKYLL